MTTSSLDRGWFRDEEDGYTVSIKVDEVLYHEKSEFQDILLFKSSTFGNALVLDGVMQCTERDEFTYQELITHLALNSHADPRQVLVVGGGDGGVVREVLKYASVERVVLCEIDEKVLEICKKYLPAMSSRLSDPRVEVVIDDGAAYVTRHKAEYDVVIIDSPSYLGPALDLYQKTFYENIKAAMKPNGVISCQGETLWFELPLVKKMIGECRQVFSKVAYALGYTPSFNGGASGVIVCSMNPDHDLKTPVRDFTPAQIDAMNLRYYSPELHRAAFTLPTFARKYFQDVLDE